MPVLFLLFSLNFHICSRNEYFYTRLSVVFFKTLDAFLQRFHFVQTDLRHAGAKTFPVTAAPFQGDRGDTVIQQLFRQLRSGHSRIIDGEIKAVGNVFRPVFFVNDFEPCRPIEVFHGFCPFAVFLHVAQDVQFPFVGGFQYGGDGILRGM